MPPTNSDSEDDLDYVPPADDHESGSSDEQEDKVENTAAQEAPDPAEQKKQRDALWASFQASVSTPPPEPTPRSSAVKRVKVEKTYLFAGKHVKDVVEVLEDSEDAKKWPRWSPSETAEPQSTLLIKNEEKRELDSSSVSPSSSSPAPPPAVEPNPVASTSTNTTITPGSKRPGPRKPRITLPAIPNATSQARKITMLDKSAMDWRTHVTSQSGDVKDELDANRRGGGYLEKVDFLQRVQDRREDAFEASKSSKRRKT